MKYTVAELKSLYPQASNDFLKANAVDYPAQSAVAQCPVPRQPLEAAKGKARYPGRVRLVVTSFRRRLLDPDNLCPKYFIDCLRYAEIIPDDSPEQIDLEIRQRKVAKSAEERTEIVIDPL